jgi:hypothetical protein
MDNNNYRDTYKPSGEGRLKIYDLIKSAYKDRRPWLDYNAILNNALRLRAKQKLLSFMVDRGIVYLQKDGQSPSYVNTLYAIELTKEQEIKREQDGCVKGQYGFTKSPLSPEILKLGMEQEINLGVLAKDIDYFERELRENLNGSLDTLMLIIEMTCYQ